MSRKPLERTRNINEMQAKAEAKCQKDSLLLVFFNLFCSQGQGATIYLNMTGYFARVVS